MAASDDSGWRGLAEDAWRVLGVGLLVAGVFALALRLRLVILPILVAGMIAVLVAPIAGWLRRLRFPDSLAVLVALAALLLAIFGVVGGATAIVVNDSGRIGDDIAESADRFAEWLSDGPLDLSQKEVKDARADLGREVKDFATSWARGGGLLKTTVTALEVLAGSLLAVVMSFFLVKDRQRLASWFLDHWAEPERSRVQVTGAAAVQAIGTYLRGVVVLGLVESTIIGGAVALFASPQEGLVVAVFTFLAAFVPIVGAIVAGALAVMVTLATSGFVPALIVAAVAIAVQQLDNDLLAPVVYGRFIEVHPLAVLLAITTGSILAGVAGAFVAVPLTAMATSARRAWKNHELTAGA